MGGNECRPLAARMRQGSVEAPIDADVGAAAERDCVRGEVGVEVVVCQLKPRHEEEVVFVPCSL